MRKAPVITTDEFTRTWIIENAVEVIQDYGTGELTLRALHYRLVGLGMTNTMQHYKRVVAAMEVARWDGRVDFKVFSDLDRAMIGETAYEAVTVDSKVSTAKYAIDYYMKQYRRNRWENQPNYVEVWIEKKALQMVFEPVCASNRVGLAACKGYPSLTFLDDAADRFKDAEDLGKNCVILYFGDYDPSGEDIPRSIGDTLERMGATVDLVPIALNEDQVREWKLPPAPAKTTDSRTANWDGLGQVELDAVMARDKDQLKRMAQEAIDQYFDRGLYAELMEAEAEERIDYIAQIKDFVNNL